MSYFAEAGKYTGSMYGEGEGAWTITLGGVKIDTATRHFVMDLQKLSDGASFSTWENDNRSPPAVSTTKSPEMDGVPPPGTAAPASSPRPSRPREPGNPNFASPHVSRSAATKITTIA
jgi:hypothetical protein